MENLLFYTQIIFGDATIFVVMQLLVFFLFVYAITGARRKKVSTQKLKQLRVSDLVLTYSLISAAIIQSVGAVDILIDFKLSVILTNLVALFYLCFFSVWFQTIIAGVSLKMGRSVA